MHGGADKGDAIRQSSIQGPHPGVCRQKRKMQINHLTGKNLKKRLAQNPIKREKDPFCFLFSQNVMHLHLSLFPLTVGQSETGNALLLGLSLRG